MLRAMVGTTVALLLMVGGLVLTGSGAVRKEVKFTLTGVHAAQYVHSLRTRHPEAGRRIDEHLQLQRDRGRQVTGKMTVIVRRRVKAPGVVASAAISLRHWIAPTVHADNGCPDEEASILNWFAPTVHADEPCNYQPDDTYDWYNWYYASGAPTEDDSGLAGGVPYTVGAAEYMGWTAGDSGETDTWGLSQDLEVEADADTTVEDLTDPDTVDQKVRLSITNTAVDLNGNPLPPHSNKTFMGLNCDTQQAEIGELIRTSAVAAGIISGALTAIATSETGPGAVLASLAEGAKAFDVTGAVLLGLFLQTCYY
jgi:hypothetical protein